MSDLGGAATMSQSGDLDICRARYRDPHPRPEPSKIMAPLNTSPVIQTQSLARRPGSAASQSSAFTRLGCQVPSTPMRNHQTNLLIWDLGREHLPLLVTISIACTLGFSVLLSGVSSPPPPKFQPFASFSCFTRIQPLLCSITSRLRQVFSLTHFRFFSSTTPRRLVTQITRPHSHGTQQPALPPSAFAPLHGLSNGPARMPP